jgi:beta-glucosidase
VEGGNPSLWTVLAIIDVHIENTGHMGAYEVAQLYVGIPGDDVPVRQLRGFAKKYIKPGGTEQIHFELSRRDLSVWNTEHQNWELRRGEYLLYVGSSVLDIHMTGTFSLTEATVIGDIRSVSEARNGTSRKDKM